jgi:hypothetical protein
MKIELQPNETPGWIGLMMEAMLSGYPGLHTWLSTQNLCSCLRLGVHLWTATQEQRDYHVFLALVSINMEYDNNHFIIASRAYSL